MQDGCHLVTPLLTLNNNFQNEKQIFFKHPSILAPPQGAQISLSFSLISTSGSIVYLTRHIRTSIQMNS